MSEPLRISELVDVVGAATRSTQQPALQTQALTQQLRELSQNPRDSNRLYVPGMNWHMEYPQGFRPNGNAVSWQSVDNHSGNVISSGTNPE